MANYPDIGQSVKGTWAPITQQTTVIGPNDKPYVADDGRSYHVLHYHVALKHELITTAQMEAVEDHYYELRRSRFLFVADGSGITYNCMYKSPPEIIKGEHDFWNVTSFFIASSTTLT